MVVIPLMTSSAKPNYLNNYPVVSLNCLVVHSRDSGSVQNKSVYLALDTNSDSEKELLGPWMPLKASLSH